VWEEEQERLTGGGGRRRRRGDHVEKMEHTVDGERVTDRRNLAMIVGFGSN
jgi:hypothetical protein